MRIAIEEYELYNNGVLLCKWFDTEKDTLKDIEDYVREAKEAHNLNPDGLEMFVADFEDDIGIYEGESLTYALEISDIITGIEPWDLKKVRYMCSEAGFTLQGAIDNVEDCDMYEDMTLEQLAEQFVEEGFFGEIGEAILCYLDYASIARDLSYDYTEHKGDIFRCN